MRLEDHEVLPATVLRGYTSEDTAYEQEDYPYGFRLRCRIRYWLHAAEKGSAKGSVRLMSQTTNPKVEGEPWNKPKASTYRPWAVMILDSREYVTWWPVSFWGPDPWSHLLMRIRGVYQQLTAQEQKGYDILLARSQHNSSDRWEQASRAYRLVKEDGLSQEELRGRGLYLDEREYQVTAAGVAAGLEV